MRLDDLAAAAARFVGESPLNRVPELDGLQIFDPPAQSGSISGYPSEPRTYGLSARFKW